MGIRIRQNTKLGNGRYLQESYSVSQYIIIRIIAYSIRFLVFLMLNLPFYMIKTVFFLLRQILTHTLKNKKSSEYFLRIINNKKLAINQLHHFRFTSDF